MKVKITFEAEKRGHVHLNEMNLDIADEAENSAVLGVQVTQAVVEQIAEYIVFLIAHKCVDAEDAATRTPGFTNPSSN